ncbi:MAG: LD-carboxypeptidase [Bacteroidia bacterium]|jgi:muramoyltetrapeptide carboxypeptidase|nr:LD-carboxypeptidase [Bacteroidia bacterium]
MLPPFLQPGDTVAIAATARKVSPEEMQPAIDLLQSWGFSVVVQPELYSIQNQFAGSDANRTASFQRLLDDRTIKAIFCARGGYGTVRMVDALNWETFTQHPKWIIGYSDITVLHSHIAKHCGIATLHAPMPINMQTHLQHAESLQLLRDAVLGNLPLNETAPTAFNRVGLVRGKLVGGNLSVLYSLLGSASDMDTEGCILFVEDLDEYLYHIDRMVVNLKRNGKLSKLAGLIVGGMSDMKDNAVPFGKSAEAIIAEHVAAFSYPVAMGFPAGHEAKNCPLVFGATYQLEVTTKSATLKPLLA